VGWGCLGSKVVVHRFDYDVVDDDVATLSAGLGRFRLVLVFDLGVDGELYSELSDFRSTYWNLMRAIDADVKLIKHLIGELRSKYGRFTFRRGLTELCYWKGVLRKREVCIGDGNEPLLEQVRIAVARIRGYRETIRELRWKFARNVLKEAWNAIDRRIRLTYNITNSEEEHVKVGGERGEGRI